MSQYGEYYIPFLLANSGEGMDLLNEAGSFSQMKSQLLNQQLARFQNSYIPNMVKANDAASSKSVQDAVQVLQDIGVTQNSVGDNLVKTFQNYLSQKSQALITSGSYSGFTTSTGQDMSFQGIANLSEESEKLNELATNLDAVIQQIKEILANIYSIIEKNYSAEEMSLINAAMKTTLPDDKVLTMALNSSRKEIASVLIPSDAQQELAAGILAGKTGNSKLAQAVIKIKEQVDALEMLKNGKKVPGEKTSDPKLSIQSLIGKIGGTLSDVSSVMSEEAVRLASQLALQDEDTLAALEKVIGPEVVQKVLTTGDPGDFVKVQAELKEDPNFQKLISESEKYLNERFNKNDVTAFISNKEISIDFGINVKGSARASKNGKAKFHNLKLEQETPLLKMFETLASYDSGVSENAIYKFAGGAISLSGKEVPKKKQSSLIKKTQAAGLKKDAATEAWQSLVEYAEISYFLTALAGEGGSLNNSLFFVYNETIYPVSKVLSGVAQYFDKISFSAKATKGSGVGNGGSSRESFAKANVFVSAEQGEKEESAAQRRSEALYSDLTSRFQAVKVTTFLNTELLSLI